MESGEKSSDEEKRVVDIPEYGKIRKGGVIYALKKDMPYFQDEEDVRGVSCDRQPGRMNPFGTYG